MSDLSYRIDLNKIGYYQFTMPQGFAPYVQIYTWGAGGGAGAGGAVGGGGGYAYSNVSIASGDIVNIVVGSHGGDASGASAGSAGKGASIGYNGGSGANQGDGEDGDAGGSGGGGAATAVLINGVPMTVAAGGGGGGGLGDDGGAGTDGRPGGVFVPQATSYYPATHPAYCSFLNTYGVWGPFPTTITINFPVSGTYTFYFSVDNYGSVVLDGSTTLFSVTGEFNYGTYLTTTHSVSSGNHTITISPVNIGGPASVGFQIIKPDSSELWNTRYLLTDTGLTGTTNGQNGTQGGSGGSGGGGGGILGGETGAARGDDGGGGEGGNGGQNYGTNFDAGSGTSSGGPSQKSTFGIPSITGNAGYDGYAILVFTRALNLQYKDSGTWKTVNNVYYKLSSPTTVYQTVTNTFTTLGLNNLAIPAGVTQINVNYLTPETVGTKTFPVTPGETINVTLGDYGVNSTITGTAGTLTIPAYYKNVFRFRGNIDDLDDTNFSVATSTPGAAFTGSGGQSTLTAGAAANGLYYVETNERYHGDLGATIDMTPVQISTLVRPFQAVISAYSGRYGPPSYAYFLQQPTSANSYVAVFRVYDPGGSEGYYDYSIGLQQQGYAVISYSQPQAGPLWTQVKNVYYKDGSFWKPVLGGSPTITPSKLS